MRTRSLSKGFGGLEPRARGRRSGRSGVDDADLLVGAIVDHELPDDAGDIAVLVEVTIAGRADIGDLLAGGDRIDRLLPVAGDDDLAARAPDLAQRRADLLAIGRARLLDRQRGQEGRVID